jgi:arylsulfatase
MAPLEAEMRPTWNTSDKELLEKIGPGEVTKALPWHTLTAEQKKFQRLKMAIHAAMITRMDRELGRVIEQIKAMNAWEDTVVLFLSDNGASSEQLIRNDGHDPRVPAGSAMSHLGIGPGWASCSNAPFRLHKSWVHEGGISSPCIAHWPNGIKDAGKIRHTPGHLIDVVPTLLDLAGSDIRTAGDGAPPMPGRSLAPAFRKDVAIPRESIYFNHSNNRALRVGDWKIVAAGKDSPWEMYDMRRDRSEHNNIIARNGAKAAEMAALWKKQDEEYVRVREAAPATTKPKL